MNTNIFTLRCDMWNNGIYTCLNLGDGRREGGFIQVVKIRVLHGFTGRDPFRRVVGQHFLTTRKKNISQTPSFDYNYFQQAQSRAGIQVAKRLESGYFSLNTHRQKVQAILVQVLHRQVSTLPLRKGAFVVRQALNIRPHFVVWCSKSPKDTGNSCFQI